MSKRYQASGPQAETQPGSNGLVLRNKPGITDPAQMRDAELALLLHLYEFVMDSDHLPLRRLQMADLLEWHRLWLGNLYEWAGTERSVNLSKDNFHFAAAAPISRLLAEFERDCLHRYTPCDNMDRASLIEAISICHVELILIHPFRDGNGRLSRLLADVMAVQAGCGPLDYTSWDDDKAGYFTAIQRGLSRDYSAMYELVNAALTSPAA